MPASAANLGDPGGDVEVDRLDDDGVDPLGNDVFRLGDLVLGVVLRRLHDHLVAGLLGGLLEEGHVGVEVAEGRLLLEHEGDPLGGARLAVLRRGHPARDDRRKAGRGGQQLYPAALHASLPGCVESVLFRYR
jgi:hypothetical protein